MPAEEDRQTGEKTNKHGRSDLALVMQGEARQQIEVPSFHVVRPALSAASIVQIWSKFMMRSDRKGSEHKCEQNVDSRVGS